MSKFLLIGRKRIFIMGILCFLMMASACNGTSLNEDMSLNEAEDPPIETPFNSSETETIEGDYWDGSDFPGQSVYSLTFGISQTAHDTFVGCNLRDNNIEHAVETYLTQYTDRQMVIAQNSQQETTSSVAITVIPLTADIFEVTCSQVEP